MFKFALCKVNIFLRKLHHFIWEKNFLVKSLKFNWPLVTPGCLYKVLDMFQNRFLVTSCKKVVWIEQYQGGKNNLTEVRTITIHLFTNFLAILRTSCFTPEKAVKLERSHFSKVSKKHKMIFPSLSDSSSLYHEKYFLDYRALPLTSNKRCNSIFIHNINQINVIRMLRFRRFLNQQLSHCN